MPYNPKRAAANALKARLAALAELILLAGTGLVILRRLLGNDIEFLWAVTALISVYGLAALSVIHLLRKRNAWAALTFACVGIWLAGSARFITWADYASYASRGELTDSQCAFHWRALLPPSLTGYRQAPTQDCHMLILRPSV